MVRSHSISQYDRADSGCGIHGWLGSDSVHPPSSQTKGGSSKLVSSRHWELSSKKSKTSPGVKRIRKMALYAKNGHNLSWRQRIVVGFIAYRTLRTCLKGKSQMLSNGINIWRAVESSRRIPGEFESHRGPKETFIIALRERMRQLRPQPTSYHGRRTAFRQQQLAIYVFVREREDGVRKPLQQPYTGPQVVRRENRRLYTSTTETLRCPPKDWNLPFYLANEISE